MSSDKVEGAPHICPKCESWMLRKIGHNPAGLHEALHCPHNLVLAEFAGRGGELVALKTEWPVSSESAARMIREAGVTVEVMAGGVQ